MYFDVSELLNSLLTLDDIVEDTGKHFCDRLTFLEQNQMRGVEMLKNCWIHLLINNYPILCKTRGM